MMAYENKFVLAILHDGHPVREISGRAHIPFHSEYKVRLKNKDPYTRAKARVWVDGRKASNLGDIILEPNQTLDLERFLTDRLDEGRKFKFVPLSDGRVNDPTDKNNGTIKVEFYKEQVCNFRWKLDVLPLPSNPPINPNPAWPNWGDNTGGGPNYLIGSSGRSTSSYLVHNSNVSCDTSPMSDPAGATVEGGTSDQKFVWGDSFATDPFPTTLTLQLRPTEEKPSRTTAAYKKRSTDKVRFCSGCGRRRSRMKDKFCPRCGNRY